MGLIRKKRHFEILTYYDAYTFILIRTTNQQSQFPALSLVIPFDKCGLDL